MYKQLYRPDHHRSDITGMVPVHILTAEEGLDRLLEKGEIVHHKDFNKLNNDPDNLLFPITRPEHQKLPEYQSRFILSKGLYEEFLVWWFEARDKDAANCKVKVLENKIVKAQNERERLRGRMNAKEIK